MPLWMLPIGKAILAPLAALWRYLAADWHRMAFAALIALSAFLCWRLSSVDGERDKWRDRAKAYEAASKAVKAADAKADAAGLETAAETKGAIDATNQRAADDAAQSDDPLDAIARRLRAEGDRGSR